MSMSGSVARRGKISPTPITLRFYRHPLACGKTICKVQKMGLTHRLAATAIKFGELKNRIKDSYAGAVSKQKAYM